MYKMSDKNQKEEYEGVTLNVETNGWPEGLVGVVINEQITYANDGIVKIVGDPIWEFGEHNEI
jgi:hypothetical protein